jgi:hypothetical protein
MRSRFALGLLAAALAALAAALPAAGKEGVVARLTTSVPLHASPGTRLEVAWTLTYPDANGRPRPFGANGVFVRLLSATGAAATIGFAPVGAYPTGEYRATVVVPKGGIGRLEIGLRGRANGRPSDVLFPVVKHASGDGWTIWLIALVAGSVSVLVLVLASALLVRRAQSAQAAAGSPVGADSASARSSAAPTAAAATAKSAPTRKAAW